MCKYFMKQMEVVMKKKVFFERIKINYRLL